jgi:kynurenine formamidase
METCAQWFIFLLMRNATMLLLSLLALPVDAQKIDLKKAQLIDLSHAFDESTIYWPTSPSTFKLETIHFGPTPAGFLSTQSARDPDYRLQLEDVKQWEKIHGAIENGAIVLLRTGWSSRWPDRKRYLGDDKPGDASNLHFPSYGAEAARYLVETRSVSALGVDTASIDYGPSTDFIVHQIANGANVPGLENLANLDRLPAKGAWIIALPMKIAGGSGGPLRAVAIVP